MAIHAPSAIEYSVFQQVAENNRQVAALGDHERLAPSTWPAHPRLRLRLLSAVARGYAYVHPALHPRQPPHPARPPRRSAAVRAC